MESVIFERGDTTFIVSKVSPITPSASDIEEFAFSNELRSMAPNENIMWLRGQYVEADAANANGQMWSSDELAIKHLTPNFMPVTVMHDPRTAVGLIADTKLLTPDADKVPRSRIDTSLAIWSHRFPEVAEEALVNYERGDLMQSMEAKSPHYSCAECGQTFQKLPPFDGMGVGAERKNWCAHLNENARRILGNVVFTGTGLIFGTRGARGANANAHLEIFQEEVAEFHERSHRDGKHKPQLQRKGPRHMEIEDRRYEELLAAEAQAKRVPDLETALETSEREKAEAVKTAETAEAAKVKAEEEKAEADKKIAEADEKAQKATLATDRLGKFGSAFKEKIDKIASVKSRIEEQAASMTDDDWAARVEELAELTGVKSDAVKEGETDETKDKGEEFSTEEIANSQSGRMSLPGGGSANQKSVVSGLFAQTAPGGSEKKS